MCTKGADIICEWSLPLSGLGDPVQRGARVRRGRARSEEDAHQGQRRDALGGLRPSGMDFIFLTILQTDKLCHQRKRFDIKIS